MQNPTPYEPEPPSQEAAADPAPPAPPSAFVSYPEPPPTPAWVPARRVPGCRAWGCSTRPRRRSHVGGPATSSRASSRPRSWAASSSSGCSRVPRSRCRIRSAGCPGSPAVRWPRSAERSFSQADLNTYHAVGGLYGTPAVPDFLFIAAKGTESSDDDRQALQSAADGLGSGGELGLALEKTTVEERDGIRFTCAPITGGGLTGSACMWNDGKTLGRCSGSTTRAHRPPSRRPCTTPSWLEDEPGSARQLGARPRAKTSVWRSTSASVVAGHISAMLWNGRQQDARLSAYRCMKRVELVVVGVRPPRPRCAAAGRTSTRRGSRAA